jgi:hypothetical protein
MLKSVANAVFPEGALSFRHANHIRTDTTGPPIDARLQARGSGQGFHGRHTCQGGDQDDGQDQTAKKIPHATLLLRLRSAENPADPNQEGARSRIYEPMRRSSILSSVAFNISWICSSV